MTPTRRLADRSPRRRRGRPDGIADPLRPRRSATPTDTQAVAEDPAHRRGLLLRRLSGRARIVSGARRRQGPRHLPGDEGPYVRPGVPPAPESLRRTARAPDRSSHLKALEVLDGHVERGDPKDAEPDALREVHADAACASSAVIARISSSPVYHEQHRVCSLVYGEGMPSKSNRVNVLLDEEHEIGRAHV